MKKKELEKKIKEKCIELDLVEEEKKKIKRKEMKYWIMGGVLIAFLIVFLIINSLDPTRVYEKNKQIEIKEDINNSLYDSIINSDNGLGLPMLIISIGAFVISIMFFRRIIFPRNWGGL